MKKVTVITTLNHNVGDDFVREGILWLLRKSIGPFQEKFIHKHLPYTSRPWVSKLDNIGLTRLPEKIKAGMSLRVSNYIDRLPIGQNDYVNSADILVQSGAPVFWCGDWGSCEQAEWWEPLIERRWEKSKHRGKRFFNIAGGTCQPYSSTGDEFTKYPSTLKHIERFYDLTDVTTVRDTLSQKVLRLANRNVEVLPCTSIYAAKNLGISSKTGEFVALNYMDGGGHWHLGQKIDSDAWREKFISFANKLNAKDKVVMVCHDKKEFAHARQYLPNIERFYSKKHSDYLELYSKSKWGILNRVHGAFAMASLGKPSAVVGTDSRAKMAEMLTLPVIFVNAVSSLWLNEVVDQLESRVKGFPDQMKDLQNVSEQRYLQLLR
jgi:hypothetical protein